MLKLCLQCDVFQGSGLSPHQKQNQNFTKTLLEIIFIFIFTNVPSSGCFFHYSSECGRKNADFLRNTFKSLLSKCLSSAGEPWRTCKAGRTLKNQRGLGRDEPSQIHTLKLVPLEKKSVLWESCKPLQGSICDFNREESASLFPERSRSFWNILQHSCQIHRISGNIFIFPPQHQDGL